MTVRSKEWRPARRFPQWALGFKNVDQLLSAKEAARRPDLERWVIEDVFGGPEQTALKLLVLFCTNTR
jgi:hypothetical protein